MNFYQPNSCQYPLNCKLPLISSIISPVKTEIQDDSHSTEKVLDNPNELLLLKKVHEQSKETKFDEKIAKVQDEVKENTNTEKVLDDPNAWALLKKAQELVKKYEDCQIRYYCKICPDFSTICESTLIEHHCSFHVNEDSKKSTRQQNNGPMRLRSWREA